MWNLWYTHKLPLKWWLGDRGAPCDDFFARPKHTTNAWPARRDKYLRRLPHQLHVEIFCKSYEYERYLIRTNRGDDDGNWRRPSDQGHVHRVPLKYDHFDLQPDGVHSSGGSRDGAGGAGGAGAGRGPTEDPYAALDTASKTEHSNPDIARKERGLAEKQLEYAQRQHAEMMKQRQATERIRSKARSGLAELDMLFANKAGGGTDLVEVGAGGSQRTVGGMVRGIPLSSI